MAILLADSFDLYGSLDDMNSRWDGLPASYQASFSTSGGRFGGGALRIDISVASLSKNLNTLTAIYVSASALLSDMSTDRSVVLLTDDNSINVIPFDIVNNVVNFTDPGGTSTLWNIDYPADRWSRVEIYLTAGRPGTVEIWVNEKKVLDTSLNTISSGATGFNIIRFYPTWWDDIILRDDRTIMGDLRMEAIYPDAAGSFAQWAPTGDTANHLTVDEQGGTDGDTTYNTSSTVGEKDRFSMGTLSGSPQVIHGLQVVHEARREGTGTREIASLISHGGTEVQGSTVQVLDGYAPVIDLYETNPVTATGWTVSDVNNLEVGYKLVT